MTPDSQYNSKSKRKIATRPESRFFQHSGIQDGKKVCQKNRKVVYRVTYYFVDNFGKEAENNLPSTCNFPSFYLSTFTVYLSNSGKIVVKGQSIPAKCRKNQLAFPYFSTNVTKKLRHLAFSP